MTEIKCNLTWKLKFFQTYFLGYGNRLRMQQLQQTDFINQQIREKQLYAE